jgi:hypothetical protein
LNLDPLLLGTRSFPFDVESALAGQGLHRDARPGERVPAAAHRAVEAKRDLVEGRFVRVAAPIAHHGASGVELPHAVLEGEAIAGALEGAGTIVTVVCTIGPLLERRVSALLESDPLLALALDGLGSAACERLAGILCGEIEQQAANHGMRVTGPLAPGMIGWPLLEAQRQVFSLVDAAPLGVVLTSSGQMIPRKSLSFVVGIGTRVHTRATCPACGSRDRCKFRPNHG